eukprot:jgi/Mesen1/5486/ME000276S04608
MAVKQPIGQKRLTNIAVVKYKKHGLKFEVACYKNKVISWRNRIEKDIDEVLQTHTIFSNVGKGTLAKAKDLKQVFGTDDEEVICREVCVATQILDKGDFQVSDKERESEVSSKFRDITSIVMEKTINPKTSRPYTMGMVERFIREAHFSIDPHKSSKQQALELIRDLQSRFPIARARMELRLSVPKGEKAYVVGQLSTWNAFVQAEEEADTIYSVVCQVDPGKFRACDALVQECRGRLEVVSTAVQQEGDSSFDEQDDLTSHEPHLPQHPLSVNQSVSGASAAGSASARAGELGGQLSQGLRFDDEEGSSSQIVSRLGSDIRDLDAAGAAAPSGKASAAAAAKAAAAPPTKMQKCNTCGAEFGDPKEYREHFKSDWHKHNLKRKMKDLPPLGHAEYAADSEIEESMGNDDEYLKR